MHEMHTTAHRRVISYWKIALLWPSNKEIELEVITLADRSSLAKAKASDVVGGEWGLGATAITDAFITTTASLVA